MTIREGERVRRKAPKRAGPIRSGSFASGTYSGGDGDPAAAPADPSVGESVAQAVRMGYDVIAENIQLGREAAAKFRQGEYNIRDVPHDAEVVMTRFMHLARELSATTFEVLEQVLKQMGTVQPPNGGEGLPPFRSPGATATAAKAPAAAADAGRMKLTVEFAGDAKATARTVTLDRPRKPAAPGDLFATPLASPGAAGAAITGVSFAVKVGIDGVIATVKVPKKLAKGVYSGLVYVRGDDTPLGVLSVEIGA
jgi:hypothetical protein